MRKGIWIALALLAVALTSLRLAGDAGYWRRYAAAMLDTGAEAAALQVQPRLRLTGGNGEVPRATAESELIAAEALQVAAETAQQQGAQALLVNRHGHRVFEYFAPGRSAAMEVAGGELSPALLALATGALVDTRRMEAGAAIAALRAAIPQAGWRNPWSAAARQRFHLAAPPALLMQELDGSIAETISGRVWLPLQAADAWLWGIDDARLRLDCCVVARMEDWMRVGDLLLQQGNYQGERIVSPDWIRQLLGRGCTGAKASRLAGRATELDRRRTPGDARGVLVRPGLRHASVARAAAWARSVALGRWCWSARYAHSQYHPAGPAGSGTGRGRCNRPE